MILIVEDDPFMVHYYRVMLRDAGLLQTDVAMALEKAMDLVEEHSELQGAIVDGCLLSDEINTEPVVKRLRELHGPDLPIVAASSLEHYADVLKRAGCNFSAATKREAVQVLIQALGR